MDIIFARLAAIILVLAGVTTVIVGELPMFYGSIPALLVTVGLCVEIVGLVWSFTTRGQNQARKCLLLAILGGIPISTAAIWLVVAQIA